MTHREASVLVYNVIQTHERNTYVWETAKQITELRDLPPPPNLVEGFINLLMQLDPPK